MANKAAAILEMINKGMSNKEIRTRMKVSPSYLWKLRKEMPHKAEENDDNVARPRLVGKHKTMRVTKKQAETIKEIAHDITRGRQARQADANSVDEILDKRAEQYGSYMHSSSVAIKLKQVIHNSMVQYDTQLFPDQLQSLDMIATKIARILTGNPSHLDSWVDIAGYAKLVSDRLQGTVR